MKTSNKRIINKAVLFLLLIVFVVNACVVYPKTVNNQNPDCDLVTKEITLDMAAANINGLSGTHTPESALVVLAGATVVVTVSAIVSGSIYIAGNTIHWIEKMGTCEEGLVQNAKDSLANSLTATGGWLVNTTNEIIAWMSGKDGDEN